MVQDTTSHDSLETRPLPKWLTDQKNGLTTIQPKKIVMREDKSLDISLIITGVFILLVTVFLTVYILRKKKNHTL